MESKVQLDPPKQQLLNIKKIISKIAPPEWLQKGQTNCSQVPPIIKKKFQNLTPPKAKNQNPQNIFRSPKVKNPTPKGHKAKSLEMIRKEKMKKLDKKEQNVQKKMKLKRLPAIANMFKLMPQAKFKVTKKKNITKPKNEISNYIEKIEPTKFKVPTGQQVRNDNPSNFYCKKWPGPP